MDDELFIIFCTITIVVAIACVIFCSADLELDNYVYFCSADLELDNYVYDIYTESGEYIDTCNYISSGGNLIARDCDKYYVIDITNKLVKKRSLEHRIVVYYT